MFPVDIAKFLRIVFLYNTSCGCCWQSYHGTVSQLGCLFFDFAPPRTLDFDQNFSRNVAQIILYYHVTKQFLPCLIWLVTCFIFHNMFWKNVNCFRFSWKTYTRLSSPVLCGWSGALNFRVWFGKWNMAVEIPILILLRFLLTLLI